ncbi:hypothetical protein [Streptomyces cinereoruber]|uniref:hypothetical protein n=1 Tax=Streptomyces cinereoruber TaxID=67260 RepID=UPI00363B699B
MRTNPWMRRLLADAGPGTPSPADGSPLFREVVEEGWSTTESGARVLTALRPERDGFHSDRLAEETTVNGRGMTDLDLPVGPAAVDERARVLLRRCLAYSAACLRAARDRFGDDAVRAYVSLSFGGLDEDLLTASVTFCTPLPDVRPHIAALERVRDAAVAELSVHDCSDWEGP